MKQFNTDAKILRYCYRGNGRTCFFCPVAISRGNTVYRYSHSDSYTFCSAKCAKTFLNYKRLQENHIMAPARKDTQCYSCRKQIRIKQWYWHPYSDSTWGDRTKKYCSRACYHDVQKEWPKEASDL